MPLARAVGAGICVALTIAPPTTITEPTAFTAACDAGRFVVIAMYFIMEPATGTVWANESWSVMVAMYYTILVPFTVDVGDHDCRSVMITVLFTIPVPSTTFTPENDSRSVLIAMFYTRMVPCAIAVRAHLRRSVTHAMFLTIQSPLTTTHGRDNRWPTMAAMGSVVSVPTARAILVYESR